MSIVPSSMLSPRDQKISTVFAGSVVRKDLPHLIKSNAVVPTYVLEYLLGQYCTSNDEATIKSGVEQVSSILRNHYVHREESQLVQSKIRERGQFRVIDRVSVELNTRRDVYEATFTNLQIKEVVVDNDTVKRNPKLLVSGIWCICTLRYIPSGSSEVSPFILMDLKPIQLSDLDIESYHEKREAFSTAEWIDLLVQSIGFNPDMFDERTKVLQLIRLIPYCERNYNLIELGPKGTGKSHIFSEFSPHGILISGGEVTVAKLFVNNSNGKIGLVGYWDNVAFDEFAGKARRVDQGLVDIMKNYMANKSFSRGRDIVGADASMVFVGNTSLTVEMLLRQGDLFQDLPSKYHDPAFLDRIHFYIPGWEFQAVRKEFYTTGYGFVVDYLAEVLRYFRNVDYAQLYREHFELSSDLSDRDTTGIRKTFSGLMKIIYPNGKASAAEMEWLLQIAIEGRKRVKDQLLRIDGTFLPVRFVMTRFADNSEVAVQTAEERIYPELYHQRATPAPNTQRVRPGHANKLRGTAPIVDIVPADEFTDDPPEDISGYDQAPPQSTSDSLPGTAVDDQAPTQSGDDEMWEPQAQHITIADSQTGINYNNLFGDYLAGATHVKITDPYIRSPYQARNLMEFIETVARYGDQYGDITVDLVTSIDANNNQRQVDLLNQVQNQAGAMNVIFDWTFAPNLHDRSMIIDHHRWKIVLGRGLDIYAPWDFDMFSPLTRYPEMRPCKACEITYLDDF